jgi:thiosulfate/3-mercaptopyruvate sulfurtransferase
VRVLDGGFAKWLSEGRPTTSEPTPIVRAKSAFHAQPLASLRRTADEVQRAVGDKGVLIIDARPSDQYAGTVSAAGRGGHIPGALNVPYPQLVDDATGTFRPERELARAFRDAGVDPDALPPQVIVYCNGGVTCTVPLMALEILGRKDVAVYDGSWNEWGNDPSRPVNAGPKP